GFRYAAAPLLNQRQLRRSAATQPAARTRLRRYSISGTYAAAPLLNQRHVRGCAATQSAAAAAAAAVASTRRYAGDLVGSSCGVCFGSTDVGGMISKRITPSTTRLWNSQPWSCTSRW